MFDLNSYLKRINFRGDTQPTLQNLDRLTECHTQAIAFENVDVVMNKPINLSADALFDKLVTKKRGGYCFEQNGLFLIVLEHLKFDVKPISARVRVRFASRDPDAPRTHVFLRVEINGESYLTDVGMGSASLTKALKLIPGIEQETPHDTRRLVKDRGRWYQQVRHGDEWYDVNEFTLEEMPLIDREVGNWYTSTYPQSHFKGQVIAARALDGGQRISLQNFEFTRRSLDGEPQKKRLKNSNELNDVLTNEFGLNLTDADREGISNFLGKPF